MPTSVPEELSSEEMLGELGRELATNRRLNLRQYFEILEWATLFTPLPADGLPQPLVRYENQGVHYVLFFTRSGGEAQSCARVRSRGHRSSRGSPFTSCTEGRPVRQRTAAAISAAVR